MKRAREVRRRTQTDRQTDRQRQRETATERDREFCGQESDPGVGYVHVWNMSRKCLCRRDQWAFAMEGAEMDKDGRRGDRVSLAFPGLSGRPDNHEEEC